MKKKKTVELGIQERLPLIPGRRTIDSGKVKSRERRNRKAETRRIIEKELGHHSDVPSFFHENTVGFVSFPDCNHLPMVV